MARNAGSTECEVSPFERQKQITLQANGCVDDEVRINVIANCKLQADNETVEVSIRGRLYEGASCGTEDLDGEETFVHDAPPAERTDFAVSVHNEDEGGDHYSGTIHVDNQLGRLIVVTQKARKVTFAGNVHVLDDDGFGETDNTGDFSLGSGKSCEVSAVHPDTSVTLLARSDSCVDDEVSGTFVAHCHLVADSDAVAVTYSGTLWEGASCGTNDQDGSAGLGPVTIAAAATDHRVLQVDNEDEGGDYIKLTVSAINEEGADIALPESFPESRRFITVTGSVHVHDDDFGDRSENETFTFIDQCYVDPFSLADNFGFSGCVDDEVKAVMSGSCKVSTEDATVVNIGINYKLFEGSTCATDDLDGEKRDQFVLPECSGDCTVTRSMRVSNEEGGDYAEFSLSFTNAQAP